MTLPVTTTLPDVFDLNIQLDTERLENGEGEHWTVTGYGLSVDANGERYTETEKPSVFSFSLVVPDGLYLPDLVDDFGAGIGDDETWIDSDGKGLPDWFTEQVRWQIDHAANLAYLAE